MQNRKSEAMMKESEKKKKSIDIEETENLKQLLWTLFVPGLQIFIRG